jgi:ribose/xylose/arabinose/galactoside ABC-type transport system permease subunit
MTPIPPPLAAAQRPLADSRSAKAALSRWLDVIGPTLALLAIFLFFYAIIGASFASFFNLQTILRQSTVVCMAGLGATFIIIAGGIDLAIGSSVAMCAMVIAVMLNHTAPDPAHAGQTVTLLSLHPIGWPLACAGLGVFAGLLTGLFNGALITGLNLAPFIVTLGTMMVFRGMTEAFSETSVNTDHNWLLSLLASPDIPASVTHSHFAPILQWLYLPTGIWITLVLAVLMAVILNYFRFGRHLTAIGSNENTARLCGIPVNRTKIYIYLVGGFFAGAAGIMQYARQRQGSPTANVGMELDVIAAVVIGGASLNGGKGSILGTIVGSLIMTVIASGCSQVPIPANFPHWIGEGVGLHSYVQKIVTGMIIVIAVTLDNLRQRRPT